MKPAIKYYHFLAVLIVAIFFTKCVENHVLPNFGKIYLNTNPPGAVIYLNDENTGKVTPDSLTELVSGEYNISLRLPAYNDSSFTVQLDEDQVLNLNVNLDETNPQGLIVLNSDPIGAEIWLNGSQTGNVTPDSVFALLREDHTITLKLAEFIDTTFQVEFDGNSRLEYDIYLIESDPQGEITLTSEPVGANITFNGQSTGRTTPATFSNLERGTYQIQLSLNLYEMAEFEIELLKDQKISRNTDLVIAGSSGSLFINPLNRLILPEFVAITSLI